jgi:hypothetical protein
MNNRALAVQDRLNLILPLNPDRILNLLTALKGLDEQRVNPLHAALVGLGNVHFAQFVMLEGNTKLGVFTIFDGEFDDYILSFTEHIGDIFNLILDNVADGADRLVKVQAHKDEFLQFIKNHHQPGLGLFSAYPNRRLFDIKDALLETNR